MSDMDTDAKLESPCVLKRGFCVNCHSHFMSVRPSLTAVIISRHFMKDLKSKEEARSIIDDILDCSNVEFSELHKFEENVEGNLIFRAKKDRVHIVYSVDKKKRIVFLRAFRNYSEYGRFLQDKKELERMIAHV